MNNSWILAQAEGQNPSGITSETAAAEETQTMTKAKHDRILLAHGGGGQLTDELIRHHILPSFKNDTLAELGDSAELNLASNSVYFTTDSYVVKPLFYDLRA